MYGVTYEEKWHGNKYYYVQDTKGNLFDFLSGYIDPVGLDSNYPKIVAVGCDGCESVINMINTKCRQKSKFFLN